MEEANFSCRFVFSVYLVVLCDSPHSCYRAKLLEEGHFSSAQMRL